jgi:hypothetical protein
MSEIPWMSEKRYQRAHTLPVLTISLLGLVLGLIGLLLRRNDVWPTDVVTLTDSAVGPPPHLSAPFADSTSDDRDEADAGAVSMEPDDEDMGEFDNELIFPMVIEEETAVNDREDIRTSAPAGYRMFTQAVSLLEKVRVVFALATEQGVKRTHFTHSIH